MIVGGVEAEKGEFPFIVGLRKGAHYCGGSIVNSEWIVTAAHCSQSLPSAYSVVAGDHYNDEVEESEQIRSVVEVIVHPDYNALKIDNDIAMMRISPPFNFDDFVQPIFIAPSGFLHPPKETVAGWGRLKESGTSPNVLMRVDVPFVTPDDCKVAYGTRISESMTCAGEDGKDACQGDSGGPLICEDKNGANVLCGVVSWGTGCARPDKFGVYAKVSHFHEWIFSTMK